MFKAKENHDIGIWGSILSSVLILNIVLKQIQVYFTYFQIQILIQF